MWLQHLFTSLMYCKGKDYQDSAIKYKLARVESSTVPPKLPKKWAAAAASRYPVMVAATCKYLEQDCTMIVPCTSHNHSQIFYRWLLSASTTALAQFSLFNCYNLQASPSYEVQFICSPVLQWTKCKVWILFASGDWETCVQLQLGVMSTLPIVCYLVKVCVLCGGDDAVFDRSGPKLLIFAANLS